MIEHPWEAAHRAQVDAIGARWRAEDAEAELAAARRAALPARAEPWAGVWIMVRPHAAPWGSRTCVLVAGSRRPVWAEYECVEEAMRNASAWDDEAEALAAARRAVS